MTTPPINAIFDGDSGVNGDSGVDSDPGPAHTLILAHGAGQGMESPFMAAFASGLARRGLRIMRFEFPYMRSARALGRRKPPDRAPVLLESWHQAIAMARSQGAQTLSIGGKSMGGRIASMIADDAGVAGMV